MSIKLAVLVSGRGSNLEAILEAIDSGHLHASVEIVISNKSEVGALAIAERHGVKSAVIESAPVKRAEHERLVVAELAKARHRLRGSGRLYACFVCAVSQSF